MRRPCPASSRARPTAAWRPFKRFVAAPSFDLSDPNVRLIDLAGDGLSDALMTGDEHLLWYRCRGESGYDVPRLIPRLHDLDLFPDVHFDDPSGRVRLADMSGDGLTDIVLVHDGRIDYWPNMGYGRFGQRVTMANAPRIGTASSPGACSSWISTAAAARIWCTWTWTACTSGSTTRATDGAIGDTLRGTPPVWDPAAVQFADFYGTGTTALIWSYDLGRAARRATTKCSTSAAAVSRICSSR